MRSLKDTIVSKPLLFLGICILAVFIVFTIYIKLDLFVNNDFDMLVKLQYKLPVVSYAFFSAIIVIGSFIPASLLLFILMRHQNFFTNAITIVAYISIHVVEVIGKFFLDHNGPPYRFFKQNASLSFPLEYSVGDSFPSGHALRVFFIATLCAITIHKSATLTPYIKRLLAIMCFVIAGSIAFGKVALGHHWVSDTIAGVLLGTSAGLIIGSTKK